MQMQDVRAVVDRWRLWPRTSRRPRRGRRWRTRRAARRQRAGRSRCRAGTRRQCAFLQGRRHLRSRRSMPRCRRRRACGGLNVAGELRGRRLAAAHGRQGRARCRREFFRKVIEINLVGTLLVCKAAAVAMAAQPAAAHDGERGVIVNDGLGRRLRRPDRPGRVFGIQGRHRRHDAADGARAREQRHPRHDHRARHLRRRRWSPALSAEAQESLGKQVPFPSRLGAPVEYAQRSCVRSSRTRCSTASDPSRWRDPHGPAALTRWRVAASQRRCRRSSGIRSSNRRRGAHSPGLAAPRAPQRTPQTSCSSP